MPGEFMPNDTRNYFIAEKATVWVQRKTADNPLTFGDKLPLGNVNSGTMTQTLEPLEHFSNFRTINRKDKELTISVANTIKVEIDEIVLDNLRYAISAGDRTLATIDVPLQETKDFAGGPPQTVVVNSGSAINSVIDVWSPDIPSGGSFPKKYVEGATGDYTVSLGTGTITRVASGDIPSGGRVKVHYDVRHTSKPKVSILQDVNIEGKVFIVSDGQQAGPRRFIFIPNARIRTDGDIELLPKDDWSKVTLNLEVIEDPVLGFGEWTNY